MNIETKHISEREFVAKEHAANFKGTPIQEFYRDFNVLVTGATGFMGKVLIEKLLRSCPNVGRIFILIRTKKGQLPEDRKEELLKSVIFDMLRASSSEFHKKLVVVTGDCSLPKLGLSKSDYELLIQQVNIIFHLAATVKFDEKFNIAIPINIGGTKEIIDLCRACVKLKSIVYTSTAYSNCHLKDIKEGFYDPPFDIDEDINKYLCTADEATIEILKPKILDKWPNTYTFTKSIAENILKTTAADLPLSIVRPSQVTAIVKEPICGWTDNIYGPTGAQIGYFTGFIKSAIRNSSVRLDLVPVDLVINSIIASAYIVGIRKHDEIPIYNSVGGNSYSFLECEKIILERILEKPSIHSIWYPGVRTFQSIFLYRLLAIFLHVIPALLLDGLLWIKGKPPMILKMYRKIDNYIITMRYFSTFEWDFNNNKCISLFNSLCENDKEIFYFDASKLNYKDYLLNTIDGVRRYIFKESDDTIPAGKVRLMKFYIAHQTIKVVLYGLIVWILWSVAIQIKSKYLF